MKGSDISLKEMISGLLSISCALMLLLSLFIFTASADDMKTSGQVSASGKITPELISKIHETPITEKLNIVVVMENQYKNFNTPEGKFLIDNEQKDLKIFLKDAESKGKAQKIKPMYIVNAIAAEVTPDLIAPLSNEPGVSKIELDKVFSIPESTESSLSSSPDSTLSTVVWGVDKIGAPAVWQEGITGKGVIVAVVDSGIDATHPDLAHLPDGKNTKVVGWIDYVNGLSFPYDDLGHGTHVAGTISGIGTGIYQTGVAPRTKLIAAKVFNEVGLGYGSDVIRAFEWAVDNKANIVSFSGGGDHWAPMTIAINNVVAAGVTPVIAAGNSGEYGSSTIGCPGDEINSITVGATDSSDIIASFSSRGPVALNGQTYIKPDVSAPGVSVISTIPAWYGASYGTASGTSMATPHVSGTVALMLNKNPSLKPLEIKQILESTAVDLGTPGKDNDYGAGRIDAYKAVMSSKGKSK